MARYQVYLAYDGTEFRGFQRQAKARTIQGVVETALRRIGWPGRSILGAGRTDTGVHASGQVIAFDLDWQHPAAELRAALNANLPDDVAVRSVRAVQPDFHPRYDAAARRYRYRIFCDAVRDPLRERYAWRVWPEVGLQKLQQLSRPLPGLHDFAAFGTPPRAGGSTVRRVFEAGWRACGEDFVFEVLGNAFLYRMVRRLVYAQVAAAQGLLKPDGIIRSLEEVPEAMIQGLAPPQGLTLVEVLYSNVTLGE